MDDYNGDFYTNVVDFFYDYYYKGEKGHKDCTDAQIATSVNQNDIEDCLGAMRKTLYKHFGIEEEK